jgi:hypothetical protein
MRCLRSLLISAVAVVLPASATADVVTDWNATLRAVIQNDGTRPVHKSNPGWSTRSIAMMNGAIYDAFQAVERTHAPYLVDAHAELNSSLEAAVHQAAYELLSHCYPDETSIFEAAYTARMSQIPNDDAKAKGIELGHRIAREYKQHRASDHADELFTYTPGTNPGQWRRDPWHPDQSAWGPGWRHVQSFAIPGSAAFIEALPPIPDLTSQAYADAFNQVKQYGALDSPVRTQEQEQIALFWAYDRPAMGPPPVLFVRHLEEIAAQAGNSPQQNARLFAMASVAQADAAIAAWDAKFEYNFWRPVGAIHEAGVGGPGDQDGNPDTVGDPTWRPLGAPGDDPDDFADDFTPPFPAWTSGHATMGGAVFKTLELFYGTNHFDPIDGILGNNPTYTLTSQEMGSGTAREFSTFTQTGLLDIDTENSPEGEIGTSRIYLGIHWIFDQRDGIRLGNDIAGWIAANRFQAVPEPSLAVPCVVSAFGVWNFNRRRRRWQRLRQTFV